MAVIDTSMNMPSACIDEEMRICPLYERCQHKGIRVGYSLPGDCPLKSTDEMIKEIEQIVDEEKINVPKWALGLKYSLHIIHKYCDKENEDGRINESRP